MNFTVDWTEETLDSLTAIWLRTPNRQAVTAAQTTIDRRLAADPVGCGIPISEGLFAFEAPPLRVQFEVNAAERRVTIVSVRELP
ncbi:MAG TPA: hypothetical protein VGG61_10050 [Gemmataceae bacterium]|jgi:hypothetical protein